MTEKLCSECTLIKPITEFGKDKNKRDGHKYMCKKCHNAKNTARRLANPEAYRKVNLAYARSPIGKAKQRVNNLRRKYWPHLTNEQATAEYNRILASQGGTCALCSRTETTIGTALHVDHCKHSGVVRGLLCDICNRIVVQDKTLEQVNKLYLYFMKHHGNL